MIGNIAASFLGIPPVTPPAGYPPVSGYSLWLDADNAASFTYSSGTSVSQWNDRSGNNYNFAQSTSTYQPDRQNAVQNGKASVYFSADNLTNTSWNWSTSAFTVFAVVKNRTSPSYDGILSRNSATSLQLGYDNSNHFAISSVSTATSSSNLTNTGSNADVIVYQSTGPTAGNIFVDLYKNGTAGSAPLALTGLIAGSTNVLGATINTGIDGIVGYISEVIIYPSSLSSTDRNSVNSYLKTKWGTP